MSKDFKSESPIDKRKFGWFSMLVIVVSLLLMTRLWYVQIFKGDYYHQISERNMIRKIEIPAARGMILDRNGSTILGNRQFFDLTYIPQFVSDKDTTFSVISRLLHIPISSLYRMDNASRGRPKFLPITLKRNLTLHEVSIIESNRILIPGIEISTAPRRDYSPETPAHLIGYLGEINQSALKELNSNDPENPYLPGELVGKQGVEKNWESHLRGKRGFRLIQVDAFGRQTDNAELERKDLPSSPATPGSNLTLTIDVELQQAVHKAFRGKYGAIIAMNPQNGEVLAVESSPGFDLSIYQDGLSVEKWNALINDPYKPLFDKTTGGEFPPGSIYKPVVAIAGLEENIINESRTVFCNGSMTLGKDTFHCHERKGHGTVNLRTAMLKSCDVYFYQMGLELGVDRIAKYAEALGLGSKLNVDLNAEASGLIPTSAWKKLTTRLPWTLGDTPPLSIGQGANLLTPMQMVSLYATIANGGSIWRPHFVKKITDHHGKIVSEIQPELLKKVEIVKPATFDLMRQILRDVVQDISGTGKNAQVDGVTVAGKTGSVQVVSLDRSKNNQGNISMKWREHALFASFSPVENPEIALIVVSENDRVGGGGASAAPVAGEVLAAYWQLKAKRGEYKSDIFPKSKAQSVKHETTE